MSDNLTSLRARIEAHLSEDHELDCPTGECHELLCEARTEIQDLEAAADLARCLISGAKR